MVCFVFQKEKEEIIQITNNQYNIIFSENFDDAKKLITDDSYVVVSLKIANQNIEKFKQLLQKFPFQDFPIIQDNNGRFLPKVVEVFTSFEKGYHNYTTENIVAVFKQKVDTH